jgi:hypothetical protein
MLHMVDILIDGVGEANADLLADWSELRKVIARLSVSQTIRIKR